jgi:hypothetical protein
MTTTGRRCTKDRMEIFENKHGKREAGWSLLAEKISFYELQIFDCFDSIVSNSQINFHKIIT